MGKEESTPIVFCVLGTLTCNLEGKLSLEEVTQLTTPGASTT